MAFTYLRDPSGTQVVEFTGAMNKGTLESMFESNWSKATAKEFEVFTKAREELLAKAPVVASVLVTDIKLAITAPGDVHSGTGLQLPPTEVTSVPIDGPVVSGTVV